VKSSSSRNEEKDLIKSHVNLRGNVTTLGHVTSDERAWLLANAKAVVYPSSAEGFGFVPHEAAALTTHTTFTNFGPLMEVTQQHEMPGNWSVQDYAIDLLEIVEPARSTQEGTEKVSLMTKSLTWNQFGIQITEFMSAVSSMDPVSMAMFVTSGLANSPSESQTFNKRIRRAAVPLRRISERVQR
jgi:glycosyltransferase involved in cell wall biosynthesis